MGKKLFVGNLPFKTTGDDLRELFSAAGTCESASVIMDRETGKSRGFGFVEMASEAEAATASEQFNNTELGGRKITVAPANDRPQRN
jgi:RNA recognition motif-containing protein